MSKNNCKNKSLSEFLVLKVTKIKKAIIKQAKLTKNRIGKLEIMPKLLMISFI
jgi:hypothetical protein